MLQLTRKIGADVIIDTPDGPLRIVVVSQTGRQTRIGFDDSAMTKKYPITRGEVWVDLKAAGVDNPYLKSLDVKG